jgi:hypothetical protein
MAAFDTGFRFALERASQDAAHKQALSDEEFQQHAQRLADALVSNRQILATIDPQKNPQEYATKVHDLRQNLLDVRQLFHPDRHPNAVARFGHLITDSLGLTDPHKRIALVASKRAAASTQDEQEAQALAASTPRQPNEFVAYRDALIDAGFSPEQAQRALEIQAGIEPKAAPAKPELWHKSGNPFEVNGKAMQPEIDSAGEVRLTPMPEGYQIPEGKQSQYESQRAAFARSLGKTPATMDWQDEQAFLSQRYSAGQPYAARRMALAEEHQRIAQASLALRKNENNFHTFMALEKSLSPAEKILTTAERADDYVNNPSGPGDAALLFSFIDAIRPGGFGTAPRSWAKVRRPACTASLRIRYSRPPQWPSLSLHQGWRRVVCIQRRHRSVLVKRGAEQRS